MVTYFFHLSHSSTGLPPSHSFLKTWAAVWSCESQHSISFEKCWTGPSYILKRSACWHSSALASVSRHNSTSIFQLLHFLQNYHFLLLFPGISIFWEPHPLQSSNTACFLIRKEKSCREASLCSTAHYGIRPASLYVFQVWFCHRLSGVSSPSFLLQML